MKVIDYLDADSFSGFMGRWVQSVKFSLFNYDCCINCVNFGLAKGHRGDGMMLMHYCSLNRTVLERIDRKCEFYRRSDSWSKSWIEK
jgi:hypothetical protein